MAVQPKPLRFLFSKYAGQVPAHAKLVGSLESPCEQDGRQFHKKSGNLRNLHLLGREISKLERIQMFFAMSEDPCECPSVVDSSVGSASTMGRSCHSQKESQSASPSRFRSRSQEFQSKYKLAVSRCSPEYSKRVPQSVRGNNQVTRLPMLNVQRTPTQDPTESVNMKCQDNKIKLQVPTEEREMIGGHPVKPAEVVTYQLPESEMTNGAKNHSSFNGVSITEKKRARIHAGRRVAAGQLPRCLSGSTVDMDRLDSSYYQYLLDDFSSLTASSSHKSARSNIDPSPASARAQRPSTSDTEGTTQRLRDIHTCGTDTTANTCHPQPSRNTKSPDIQWPPRYAIIPSWPSYEDIQTLNSCGEHCDIMTRLYRKDVEGKYGRRSRDRGQKVNYWSRDARHYQTQKVHVVPSHTNTECAVCNLYKHNTDTTLCPPNTPMVTSHDRQDGMSRLSTNYSLKVNHGHISTASGESSRRGLRSFSSEYNLRKVGDISSMTPSRDLNFKKATISTSNSTQPPGHRNKGVSYSWDTCKLAYVKAHA